jgi:hypothetical protein
MHGLLGCSSAMTGLALVLGPALCALAGYALARPAGALGSWIVLAAWPAGRGARRARSARSGPGRTRWTAATALVHMDRGLGVGAPRGTTRSARTLAERSSPEDGFTVLEALIAAALIAMVILGGTVVFSQQKQTLGQPGAPDALRDELSALDVDANALAAYDQGVQAKIQAGGTQLWTAALPAGDVVTIQAQPASGGIAVIARTGSQAASIVVPLSEPKPLPQ